MIFMYYVHTVFHICTNMQIYKYVIYRVVFLYVYTILFNFGFQTIFGMNLYHWDVGLPCLNATYSYVVCSPAFYNWGGVPLGSSSCAPFPQVQCSVMRGK
jgi:hypothetical protein